MDFIFSGNTFALIINKKKEENYFNFYDYEYISYITCARQ